MHVQDLKRWHWVAISIVVGLALSYVWSSVEWDENLPTVGQADFERGLAAMTWETDETASARTR